MTLFSTLATLFLIVFQCDCASCSVCRIFSPSLDTYNVINVFKDKGRRLETLYTQLYNDSELQEDANVSIALNQNKYLFETVRKNNTSEANDILHKYNNIHIKEYYEKISRMNTIIFYMAIINNNTDIFRSLISFKAPPFFTNECNNDALHLAIESNNMDIASLIIEYDKNIINERNILGETALHVAARNNNSYIYNFILGKGGNPYMQSIENTTSLHIASYIGSKEIVNAILSMSTAGVNLQNYEKNTALELAASRNNTEICKLLLSNGADPYIVNVHGKTTLHICVTNGLKELLNLILMKNATGINVRDIHGNTALMESIYLGNTDITELLMKYGADPNIRDNNEWTLLHVAVRHKNMNILNFLLQINSSGINIQDASGDTALHVAVKEHNHNAVEALIKHEFDPCIKNTISLSPISLAVLEDCLKCIQNMLLHLDFKNCLNEEHANNPMFLAVEKNKYSILQIFIRYGGNPNIKDKHGDTLLHIASKNGNLESMKTILEFSKVGIDAKNSAGNTPLLEAGWFFRWDVIKLLLDHGADPDVRNLNGKTILSMAVAHGSKDLQYILEKSTAKINDKDEDGNTPLSLAYSSGNVGIIKLLLDYGADPYIDLSHGWTLLHLIALHGRYEIAKITLDVNSRGIDTVDGDGNTALHLACYYGNIDIVDLLIHYGANPRVKNINGKTVLHYSSEARDVDCAEHVLNFSRNGIDDADYDGETALNIACTGGKYDVLELLLNYGANPYVVDLNGRTSLHIAVLRKHMECVEFILNKNNFGIDLRDKGGLTALNLACALKYYEATNILLRNGASVNTSNNDDLTPLHMASSNKDLPMVKLLFSSISNKSRPELNMIIDFKDIWGNTPLCNAARIPENDDVLIFLIEQGADLTLVNNLGENIFHCIKDVRNIATLEYIYNRVLDIEMVANKNCTLNYRDVEGKTPLLSSAFYGKVSVFHFLLNKGCDPYTLDYRGRNILHEAAYGSSFNLGVLKYILNNMSIPLNSKAYDKTTPLMVAAIAPGGLGFQFLLEKGANLEGVNSFGVTLLHMAAESGTITTLQRIIDAKVFNINVKDEEDNTPLMYSVKNHRMKASEFLLNNGADPYIENVNKENSIYMAAGEGMHIFRLFTSLSFDPDQLLGVIMSSYDNSMLEDREYKKTEVIYLKIYLLLKSTIAQDSLYLAASKGDAELVRSLIDTSNNPTDYTKRFPTIMREFLEPYEHCFSEIIDNRNSVEPYNEKLTPLDIALLFYGNLKTVKLLTNIYKPYVSLNYRNTMWTTLDFAMYRDDPEILEFMLNQTYDSLKNVSNKYGWTAVHKAAWMDKRESLRLLHSYGADFDQKDLLNRTPLHISALNGLYLSVYYILSITNKSLNSLDSHGFTPIHLATIYSQRKMFQRLSKAKSTLPTKEKSIFVSLENVSRLGHYRTFIQFIRRKAELDVQDKAFGYTPLHWAALLGDVTLSKLLVDAGATVNIPSWRDETPMEIARLWGRTSVYYYLKSKNGVW